MTANNNDPRFVEYYEQASSTQEATQRATRLMDTIVRARAQGGMSTEGLAVADIGCNAGTQSTCWLERNHTVCGLDISESLIAIATKRNERFGERAKFVVGSASSLPWRDGQFDVVLLPELLEHVTDWVSCLSEAVRVLKRGGSLFLSTTNKLCPVQQEFDLPLYSWYPKFAKDYCVKLSTTTRPQLVNFTSFPAIHWFSPYQLRNHLLRLGVRTQDRFDLIDVDNQPTVGKVLVNSIRHLPPLRLLAHLATPYTFIVGHKTA